MIIFDAHCDVLNAAYEKKRSLLKNDLHFDLIRAKKYGGYTQFFAVWLESEYNARQKFDALSDLFDKEVKEHDEYIQKCLSYKDLKTSRNKVAAFLSLEGAYFVKSAEDIDYIYRKGVRCVSFTWNTASPIAGGIVSDIGVTALGQNLIPIFEQKGILTDVSHLNEKSFWDFAKIAKKPFIASHSCSETIAPHKRNLTDEQFLKICSSGGCVGINFYPPFLSNKGIASIDTVTEHIKYFKKIGGTEHIGFGGDFDGIDSLPRGIYGVESFEKLASGLRKSGFSSSEIDKITHLNFERVIKDVLS